MKAACNTCDDEIVSSLDGTQWFHWPEPGDTAHGILRRHRTVPVRHNAAPAPGTIKHTCLRFDRHCPLCQEAAARP